RYRFRLPLTSASTENKSASVDTDALLATKRVRYRTLLRYDVIGLQALGTARDRKLDGLAFLQGAIAFGLDGAMMDEDVLAAILGQEAIALGGVEPLDGAYNSIVRH